MSIISEVFKKPLITFGLKRLTINATVNEPVRVYITNILNSKAFGIAGKPDAPGGLIITKISAYEFEIKYSTPGVKQFYVISSRKREVGNKTKTITRESNPLTINVT